MWEIEITGGGKRAEDDNGKSTGGRGGSENRSEISQMNREGRGSYCGAVVRPSCCGVSVVWRLDYGDTLGTLELPCVGHPVSCILLIFLWSR